MTERLHLLLAPRQAICPPSARGLAAARAQRLGRLGGHPAIGRMDAGNQFGDRGRRHIRLRHQPRFRWVADLQRGSGPCDPQQQAARARSAPRSEHGRGAQVVVRSELDLCARHRRFRRCDQEPDERHRHRPRLGQGAYTAAHARDRMGCQPAGLQLRAARQRLAARRALSHHARTQGTRSPSSAGRVHPGELARRQQAADAGARIGSRGAGRGGGICSAVLAEAAGK